MGIVRRMIGTLFLGCSFLVHNVVVGNGKVDPIVVENIDCEDVTLSAKAIRMFCDGSINIIKYTTAIPVDHDVSRYPAPSSEDKIIKPEGPMIYEVPGTTESSWFDEDLPECSELIEGFNDMDECKNSTKPEPIFRWRDMVFERVITQSWEDIQNKIYQNEAIGGVFLNPLIVDNLTGKALELSQSATLYSADLKMWNIHVHGLQTIYLSKVLVTRAQNLYDFDMKVEFHFDKLSVNGMYNLNGTLGGGWLGTSFTSDGDQRFDADIVNATIAPSIRLDTNNESNSWCNKSGQVLITDIEIPFNYDDISINLDNLGYGYNAVINGLNIFIIKTQEDALVTYIRNFIKEQFNSFMC